MGICSPITGGVFVMIERCLVMTGRRTFCGLTCEFDTSLHEDASLDYKCAVWCLELYTCLLAVHLKHHQVYRGNECA